MAPAEGPSGSEPARRVCGEIVAEGRAASSAGAFVAVHELPGNRIVAAAQPEDAGAVSLAPARSGWLSWPVLRWGAAMACVVVVGVAVTIRQEHEPRQIDATIAEQKLNLKSRTLRRAVLTAKVAEQTIAANPTSLGRPPSYETGENNKAAREPGRNGRCWRWLSTG